MAAGTLQTNKTFYIFFGLLIILKKSVLTAKICDSLLTIRRRGYVVKILDIEREVPVPY